MTGSDDPQVLAYASQLYQQGSDLIVTGAAVIKVAKNLVDLANAVTGISKSVVNLTTVTDAIRPVRDWLVIAGRSTLILDDAVDALTSKTAKVNQATDDLVRALKIQQAPSHLPAISSGQVGTYTSVLKNLLGLQLKILLAVRSTSTEEALRGIEEALREQ